jgi:integrase
MYEHRYKYGKQKTITSVEEFKQKLEAQKISPEQRALLVLLWHCGVRKSEAYERVKEDVEMTDTHVIVDFHQRKKHGEAVPPLKIPRKFYGVEEYLIPYLCKPKRARPKTLYTYETREKKLVAHSEKVEGRWLFPHIGSTTAWRICKEVLAPSSIHTILDLGN